MTRGVLKKDDLSGFIKQMLAKGTKVKGPVPENGAITLSEITGACTVDLNFFNYTLPLKREFFPFCETILAYNGGKTVQAPRLDEKTVFFAVRPCDANALLCLDKIFLDEKFTDPFYKRRRDQSLIIALACEKPRSTCFCTSVGGSPADKKACDIMMYKLQDSLLFESCTPAGESFLKEYSSLLNAPGDQELKEKEIQASKASQLLSEIEVEKMVKDLAAQFHSPNWDRAALGCIGCGVCTYLCPTCHCFGIHDEMKNGKGRRLKVHDSCQFNAFTAEASGHNPRKSRAARMRQRIMHKFNYTVEKHNTVFCVGCGRCIIHCPVNKDIKKTLAEVTR